MHVVYFLHKRQVKDPEKFFGEKRIDARGIEILSGAKASGIMVRRFKADGRVGYDFRLGSSPGLFRAAGWIVFTDERSG